MEMKYYDYENPVGLYFSTVKITFSQKIP